MKKNKEFYLECQKQIKLRGETLQQTAERYGIHRSGLQRILEGDWGHKEGSKGAFILESLCKYLGIDFEEVNQ